MTMLRSILLGLTFILVPALGSHAQTPAAPPPGMTQEQFDGWVDAIAKAVAEKLKAEGVKNAPAQPAVSKSGKPAATSAVAKGEAGPDAVALFMQQGNEVAHAIPTLGQRLGAIPRLLDDSARGGSGAMGFLLLLGLAAVIAVTAEAILRKFLAHFRQRLAAGSGAEQGIRSLVNIGLLGLLDGIGLLAVWLISHAAIGLWFAGADGQSRLAVEVLRGIFEWRLYVFAFRLVLQPGAPKARLCAIDDGEALALYARISVVTLLVILWRIGLHLLGAVDTPPRAVAAFQGLGALIYLAAFLWLVIRSKEGARQWLEGLGAVSRLAGIVGRNWIAVAVPFFVALGLTDLHGVISGKESISAAMLLTLGLVIGVLFFETLLQAFVRRLDSQLPGRTPASDTAKLPDVVARCVRVAVLIGVAVTISQSWVVDVLGLVEASDWERLTRSSRIAGITLFLAFVVWEFFKYVTDPYVVHKAPGGLPGAADPDATSASANASRLGTIMPLLRVTMAIVIGIVAVLIALEDIGVNTMPLLAGASVLGLAVSFGSQSLVRDIVSGIFYLTDDAFRVGEYIDCGKAKGSVEGFTLRSIKLRHQNGQVHTIPFGQLGQITNFSRDWITVKFNLRFARDTDMEKLRKASKKIGAELMEIPEFKEEILAPFKMQGIADITDNALLIRFKFTAKPGNPAAVQREAVKRMVRTFPELGIEFAKEGPAVVLQSPNSQPEARSVATVTMPQPAHA